MRELAKIPFPEVKRLAQAGPRASAARPGCLCRRGICGIGGAASRGKRLRSDRRADRQLRRGAGGHRFSRHAVARPGDLASVVVEIGRSLVRHDLKRLAILNGHRDLHHMKALDEARQLLVEENNAQVICVGFASDPEMTAACYREGVKQFYRTPRPDGEGHGGESETSVALYSLPIWKIVKNPGREFRLQCRSLPQRNQGLRKHQRRARLLRLAAGGDG